MFLFIFNNKIIFFFSLDLGMGFFSMNYELYDLTKRINAIYKNHDKFSLNNIIENTSKRLVIINFKKRNIIEFTK